MTTMCSNGEKQVAKKKRSMPVRSASVNISSSVCTVFSLSFIFLKNTMKLCYNCDKNEKFAPQSRFIINNLSKHSRGKATPPVAGKQTVTSHVAGAGPRPQLSGMVQLKDLMRLCLAH
jgi:hypothetical protein